MKIAIIGGRGTIGQAVVNELATRHSLIVVGRESGDIQMDITDIHSIEKMYQTIGTIDAVIATTGNVHFGPLLELTPSLMNIGIQSKLLGQINLVLVGLKYLTTGGSFTLTSGILSDDPIRFGTSASTVSGALNAFVKSAAIELPNQLRINVVSPTVLEESMEKYAAYFRGFESVSAKRVALAYSKSVEGAQTGQIYKVW